MTINHWFEYLKFWVFVGCFVDITFYTSILLLDFDLHPIDTQFIFKISQTSFILICLSFALHSACIEHISLAILSANGLLLNLILGIWFPVINPYSYMPIFLQIFSLIIIIIIYTFAYQLYKKQKSENTEENPIKNIIEI